MSIKVHLLDPPDARELEQLRIRLVDVDLSLGPDVADDAEVLVAGRPGVAEFEASPALRALVIPFSGLPPETLELAKKSRPKVSIHNLHHNAAATAELAVTLLMAASKRLLPMDRKLRAGDWTPRYEPSAVDCLEGQTALILGYGAVGRRIAGFLRALGMRVRATRRKSKVANKPGMVEVHEAGALKELLPETQALIVSLPLTPETRDLLGYDELHLLPRGALVVNVGRAEIIDEEALYDCLTDGHLAAGLDVWYAYPEGEKERTSTPPSRFPFGDLDNVVLSPHRAGTTRDSESRRMVHLAELLNAAARGRPIPNRVNVKAGY